MTQSMEPAPSFEAEYLLEAPINCVHCKSEIASLHVVRLLRGKVNFTSTLPRKGFVLLCSSCHGIISANLGSI